jgi:hypothetical protein
MFIYMLGIQANAQILGTRGNGNIVIQNRQLPDFTKIEILGSADVVIRQGDQTAVQVHADENLVDMLTTEVRKGALVVSGEGNIRSYNKFEVHVTMQRLDEIVISGSGDVESVGKIEGNELTISIFGSGDVSLDMDYKNLNTQINGSGDVQVSGIAGDLDLTIMGSGDFQASNLKLDNCTIKMLGSGDVKLAGRAATVKIESMASGDVNLNNLTADDVEVKNYGSGDIITTVTGSLKVTLMGSGDLTYRGDPDKVDVSTLGSGSVYKR